MIGTGKQVTTRVTTLFLVESFPSVGRGGRFPKHDESLNGDTMTRTHCPTLSCNPVDVVIFVIPLVSLVDPTFKTFVVCVDLS